MRSRMLVAALLATFGTATTAATVNYAIEVDASIGWGTPVETWTIGVSFDTDTIVRTEESNFGNFGAAYTNATGTLMKGAQTAQVDDFRINLSQQGPRGLNSIVFAFTIDDRSTWAPIPAGLNPRFYDGDLNDGLSFISAITGDPLPLDINSISFSFGSNFRGAVVGPTPLQIPLTTDFLNNAAFAGISGGVFGVQNGRGGPGNLTLFDGITNANVQGYRAAVVEDAPAVPLPAAGWLLIAGLGSLAAMRRRKPLD